MILRTKRLLFRIIAMAGGIVGGVLAIVWALVPGGHLILGENTVTLWNLAPTVWTVIGYIGIGAGVVAIVGGLLVLLGGRLGSSLLSTAAIVSIIVSTFAWLTLLRPGGMAQIFWLPAAIMMGASIIGFLGRRRI